MNLLIAKSKIAPTQQLTIPRLELMAADLLGKLFKVVQCSMELEGAPCFLWSNSTITLQWLRKPISELKIFVANRVKRIKENSAVTDRYHVRTHDNPADLVSRGLMANEIVNNSLWWHGPAWLLHLQKDWPESIQIEQMRPSIEMKGELKVQTTLVQREQCNLNVEISNNKSMSLFDLTNNFRRLIRIVSYVSRFIRNSKKRNGKNSMRTRRQMSANIKPYLPTEEEKASALQFLIKEEQRIAFKKEINYLKNLSKEKGNQGHEEIDNFPNSSKILNLHPCLDDARLLRVGGRLENAIGSFDMRHPVIIPNGTRLSHFIISDAHVFTEHGSIQVMMQYIRTRYWIPKLRSELRTFVRKCVICARYDKQFETQLMADLPSDRVNKNRAFLISGVDFAGPIYITQQYKRKVSKVKCWIAIFVCMVTRAVHIDAVTELSAAAFIACYERFVHRRGHCNKIYSDNGTNFVGASKELKEAFEKWNVPDVHEHLNKNGTEWAFNTPSAPHRGGIFEAAVKSMKFHLRRAMGAKHYTYEYLTTLLSKIEAIMNSRPI